MAQIHRFRDSVAVSLGGGETVYLSYRDARAYARALNKVARSVEREPFADSGNNTHEFEFEHMRGTLARHQNGHVTGAKPSE